MKESEREKLIREIDDILTGRVIPQPTNKKLVDEIDYILNSNEKSGLIKYEK